MHKQNLTIGVLGLQGAYQKHHEMLQQLNCRSVNVRYPDELAACDGLIIPGGESTTMSKLMDRIGLRDALAAYNKPMFGTCAGAIMLSADCQDERVKTLKKIPLAGLRNAYGRQVESFTDYINVEGESAPFKVVFIRAPKLVPESPDVRVLARFHDEPVLVQYQNILAASFHPELSGDPRIHQYFIEMIVKENE